MARITNFIYCLKADIADTDTNVIGILSAISPEYIPGVFSFSVFCSIVDLEEGNHNLKILFMSPKEEVLAKVEGDIPYTKPVDVNLPKQHVGINISAMLQNVVFKESGIYKTVVCVDEETCGSYDIFVKGKNEAV